MPELIQKVAKTGNANAKQRSKKVDHRKQEVQMPEIRCIASMSPVTISLLTLLATLTRARSICVRGATPQCPLWESRGSWSQVQAVVQAVGFHNSRPPLDILLLRIFLQIEHARLVI